MFCKVNCAGRKRENILLFLRKVWYTVPYSNRKGTFFLRTIGRLLLSAIFLVLTALLVLAAKYAPALVFSFYPELSRKALGVISAVTSAVPLAVWELLAGRFCGCCIPSCAFSRSIGAFCAGWQGLCSACAWGCSSLLRSGVLTILDPLSASSWGFPCASTRSRSFRRRPNITPRR